MRLEALPLSTRAVDARIAIFVTFTLDRCQRAITHQSFFGKGWRIATAPSIPADSGTPQRQPWTAPAGSGTSLTLVFDRQPTTFGFQYYKNVKTPDTCTGTVVRFAVTFLFSQRSAGN